MNATPTPSQTRRRHVLTDRQYELLDAIDRMSREHGYPPTITELCERLGGARTVMWERLQRLVAKGYLASVDRKHRSIRILRYVQPSQSRDS